MKCPTANRQNAELLLAHAAHTLDADRTAVLEEHLARCPACRDYYAAQVAVWAALDSWEAPPVSADFDRRLYSRIEAAPQGEFARVFRALFGRRALPIAAVLCLLVAAAAWLERPEAPGRSVPPQAAAVQVLPPEQAEYTLQEMQMIQDFSSLVQPDSTDPRM